MSWYLHNTEYYKSFQKLISEHYPFLHIVKKNRKVYLNGTFYLYDVEGKEIDYYQIEIEFQDDYPRSVPIVYEIGGRIPRIMDRHVYPDKGNCCLFLLDETFRYYKESDTIVDFLKGPVESYFLSQTYYENKPGEWIFGQRSHGVFGILEFYGEILNTKNVYLIGSFLSYLIKDEVKGHWQCFCGSRILMRKCHFNILIEYRNKIDKKAAVVSYNRICEYVKTIQRKKAG